MINQTQTMMCELKLIYNTEVAKVSLCDYNVTYIIVGSNITVAENFVTLDYHSKSVHHF